LKTAVLPVERLRCPSAFGTGDFSRSRRLSAALAFWPSLALPLTSSDTFGAKFLKALQAFFSLQGFLTVMTPPLL
jgi:hypothetical protein